MFYKSRGQMMGNIIYKNQLDYLKMLRREPDELIYKMEEYAGEKQIPILDWKAAELLEQAILMKRPKRVLEIGTAIAYSSIRIARKLRKKASLDTIEKSKNNIRLANEYIREAKLNNINIIEGDALNIMPALEKKYDFIFLDADKQDYERLFFYSLMLLKKNGVLFIDNLLWHGYAAMDKPPKEYERSAGLIKEFNKLITYQDSMDITIIPVGDGIGIGVKK
jgi:predicted O-methyltransferase YrrM